jgi:hypothetical protein
MRIAVLAALLVIVIVIQRPCADAVARFVAGFDPPSAPPDAQAATPEPPGYVHLHPGMSDAELREAIRRARAAAASPALPAGTGSDAGVAPDADVAGDAGVRSPQAQPNP